MYSTRLLIQPREYMKIPTRQIEVNSHITTTLDRICCTTNYPCTGKLSTTDTSCSPYCLFIFFLPDKPRGIIIIIIYFRLTNRDKNNVVSYQDFAPCRIAVYTGRFFTERSGLFFFFFFYQYSIINTINIMFVVTASMANNSRG